MNISRIDDYIKTREGLTSLTRADIETMQLRKLNRLLTMEKERGGFYKGLPDHLDSLPQLSSLPFTTDEDLAANGPAIVLKSQRDIQRVLSDATSGTTGTPKRVFYTREDCENTIRFYAAGLGEFVYPGSTTMICMPFSGPYGLGELIAAAIENLGARPLKLGPGLTYGEYRESMEREQPDTFVGMPVQLLSILRACGRGSLRRALVSGDACPDVVMEECEKLLGSRLYPHYGSREMAMAGAITCPAHDGMHLRENHMIAEIVDEDGTVLPHGACGELVITTIGMEAMPLIRYRTGDYTRILPTPCPCGSQTIRLDRLDRTPNGTEITNLDNALFALPEVVDFRVTRGEAGLQMDVLTVGPFSQDKLMQTVGKTAPFRDIAVSVKPVSEDDRSLFLGKRSLKA